MGVSKNMGTPKRDGENNGKPYFLMDDLGQPTILGTHPYMEYLGSLTGVVFWGFSPFQPWHESF